MRRAAALPGVASGRRARAAAAPGGGMAGAAPAGGFGAGEWPPTLGRVDNAACGTGADGVPVGRRDLLLDARALLPPLDLASPSRKGEAGRVGVVGGCAEYAGAPYFAALAALRTGSDLAHVFCSRAAGPVIKAFSPELIVHPSLAEMDDVAGAEDDAEAAAAAAEAAAARVGKWLPRLTALVVGPGLGRDAAMLGAAARIVAAARARGLPLVLDADGLFLVAQQPELVRGYALCVLTPNATEFARLAKALDLDLAEDVGADAEAAAEGARRLAAALGGVTVLRKGAADAVADGAAAVALDGTAFPGAPRRCGGQGDVLAGALAAFVGWAAAAAESDCDAEADGEPGAGRQTAASPLVAAAFGAAFVTRHAAWRAFGERRRAMVAGDLLEHVGPGVARYLDAPVGAPGRAAGQAGFF